MENPFESITARLNVIEHLLQDLKLKFTNQQKAALPSGQPLTIQETAEFLNLSVPTVYNMVYRKEIPYYKPAGTRKLYFLQGDLEAWVKTGRRRTLSEIEKDSIELLQPKQKGDRNEI